MAKPVEPQSFEVAGTRYEQAEDRWALLKQIASELPRDTPSSGFLISLQEDDVMIKYQCIDRLLDDRRRLEGLIQEAEKHVKEYLKTLKSEYRTRSGHTLKFKEDKDRRNYTVQKISLNGTFHFVYQQVYAID